MPVYQISGVGAVNNALTSIEVDKATAEASFLTMVIRNDFSLRDVLKSDAVILDTQVRQFYASQGYDFEHLKAVLSFL